MYGTPSRCAITQSPDCSMLRAICAWTASTSSIRAGGEMMQPRKIAAPISSKIKLDSKREIAPVPPRAMVRLEQYSSVSSTGIVQAIPKGDIRGLLASASGRGRVAGLRQGGKGQFALTLPRSEFVPKEDAEGPGTSRVWEYPGQSCGA